jgi:hypothetical protein
MMEGNPMKRNFLFTSMPVWLVLTLILIMVPRTLLSDLGTITAETPVYYFFALLPFAAWLGVAMFRPNKRSFRDFLVLGVLYSLTLIVIHQWLWNVGSSLGHSPPQAALDFSAGFDPAIRDMAVRGYTIIISLLIGIGSGAVVGLIAAAARLIRSRQELQNK